VASLLVLFPAYVIMENTILTTVALTLGAQLLFQIPTDLSESDEYEDSDEEEVAILIIRRKRKLHTPQRIENFVERVVVNFTAQQFQQHFRITVDTYENLLGIIGPQLTRQRIIEITQHCLNINIKKFI
jgi:hypothetical protein